MYIITLSIIEQPQIVKFTYCISEEDDMILTIHRLLGVFFVVVVVVSKQLVKSWMYAQ